MIKQPGIFFDIEADEYHRDPCPNPSMSQSLAKVLLQRSPLHAWHAHPRLNPDYVHDDDTKFDIGNIAHKMLLGRGKEIVVLDFDDWRTKAAKEARDVAAAEGKLAVLGKQAARADRMIAAAREQLETRDLGYLFQSSGKSEVVVAWTEDGFWFRQMLDWLSDDTPHVYADYKTTKESAAPDALARKLAADGWHIQAAMAERGLTKLGYEAPRCLFVVQEETVPYALSVVEIGPDAMTMGRKMLDAAVLTWMRCMSQNRFPGYPLDISAPEFPGWAEQQWLDREIKQAARERVPEDLRYAG